MFWKKKKVLPDLEALCENSIHNILKVNELKIKNAMSDIFSFHLAYIQVVQTLV